MVNDARIVKLFDEDFGVFLSFDSSAAFILSKKAHEAIEFEYLTLVLRVVAHTATRAPAQKTIHVRSGIENMRLVLTFSFGTQGDQEGGINLEDDRREVACTVKEEDDIPVTAKRRHPRGKRNACTQ